MPKNKRPRHRPGTGKAGKRAGDGKADGGKPVAKTYGTRRSSRSSISPSMSLRSTRKP